MDEEEEDKRDLPTNGITNPIHNNVKPENIDLNASGHSRLSDDVFLQ
jgi:hypothetical protein